MDIELIFQVLTAGICLYAGLLHFMIGVRSNPVKKLHLSFGLLSLLFAIYNLNLFFLYDAFEQGDLAYYVFVDRWGIGVIYLIYAFLILFIGSYSDQKVSAVTFVFCLLYVGISVSSFILEFPWIYTDIQLTESFPPDIVISSWYRYELVATILLLTSLTMKGVVQLNKNGDRSSASILAVAMSIYLVSYFWDIAIEFGLLDSFLIQQYGFLAFIIIMSMRLSGTVVSAEAELRSLNINLENLVEERTRDLNIEKKNVEASFHELREGEIRLDHVLRSAGMATWEYNLQTQETVVTDMFPLMLGYEPNQILVESESKWRGYKLGHRSLAAQLLNEDDKERYGEALTEMIAGKHHFEVEYRLRRADGEWIWVRDHGRIVKYDEEGKPLLAYGVVTDIDGMKKLQLELVRAKESAESANRAKSVFLANMSHELRTPLNTILGNTQILSRHNSLKADELLGIQAIDKSGEHLLELINSVLEMSKIEAGQSFITPSKFTLDALISDIEMMFVERIQQKGLTLSVQRESSLDSLVEADRSKINQILINLMSNAIRYTPSGTIALRHQVIQNSGDEPRLIVEIEDTGPGISAELQEKIFEPFSYADIDRVNHTGAGLGLAISRQYAELMGGSLRVDSTLGQGATFRLEIPVMVIEEEPDRLAPSESRTIIGIEGDKRDYRILVVDDLAANRDVLVRMLQPVGFQTQQATGGQEAIDICSTSSPHLVLTDIRMPEVDGLEAIRAIKSTEKGRSTPIIGISASVFEEDRAMVLDSGADDFLPKPFKEADLFEKIGTLLGITYVFDDDTSESDHPSEAHVLSPGHVSALPEELLNSLREALQGGYMTRLKELIQSEADNHPELCNQLIKLVDNFDYDTLSTLFLLNNTDSE